MLSAVMMGSPDSARILRPRSSLVPFILTTSGTARRVSCAAAMIPFAMVSQRMAAYELTKKSGFYDKNPGADVAIKELTNKPPTANSKGIRFGNYVQGREVIEEEMEAVFAGKKDAKTALDDAVKRGNDILRKFQAANK